MNRDFFKPFTVGALGLCLLALPGAVRADTTGLSGTMNYSLDPARIRTALAEYGITSLPTAYHGAMMIDSAGLRMVTIAKSGDPGGNAIVIMAIENVQQLRAKARQYEAHGVPANVRSIADTYRGMEHRDCTGDGTYDVQTVGEMVPVRVLSCHLNGHARTIIEEATITLADHPLVLVGTNAKGKFDEWAFKQIVAAAGSQ